jgi:hypothetical protein
MVCSARTATGEGRRTRSRLYVVGTSEAALALTHYRDLVESVGRVNVLEEGIKRLTRVLRDVSQRQSLLTHEQEEMAAVLKTVGSSSFPELRF